VVAVNALLNKLAVIIPVGPGDETWRALLPQLTFLPTGAEICLVFCVANLPTAAELPQLAAKLSCRTAAVGRAKQLNAGVNATQNSELWFLHADSTLSANTPAALIRALCSAKSALYYFDLRFASNHWKLWINELGVWWRSRLFRLPFGDQALLLSRDNFLRLGGYDETLLSAEDHALVWHARQADIAICAIGALISTSARRYQEFGWGSTTLKHLHLSWTQARYFAAQSARKTAQKP
jgi:hypothetical protein